MLKIIANFMKGALWIAGFMIVLVACIALPLWFSVWLSGGALWGVPVCVFIMVSIVGGVVYAVEEAVDP